LSKWIAFYLNMTA